MKITIVSSVRYFVFTLLFFTGILFPQESGNKIEKQGKITFKSSQNIYVSFSNTEGIKTGDTLYVRIENILKPVIIVKYLSTSSCAGESFGPVSLVGDETIIAVVDVNNEKAVQNSEFKQMSIDTLAFKETKNIIQDNSVTGVKTAEGKKYLPDNNYYGKFSVQSISSLANTGSADDLQRWRYSLSFNKNEFLDTKLSLSSYIIFAYTANQWSRVKSNINNSLKIYDLSLSYKLDEKTTFWFGRHLNNKVGNIGATDGIQVERQLGDYYAGFIIGSRPNYSDYSYNIKLFEYGGYFGRTDKLNNSYMENVVGAFQQTNNMKTDRRFVYFQHSNNLIPKTNIFFSTELDLYKKEKSIGKSTLRLTSLYLSLRVSPSRFFSVSASYDARRNVVYYETYKFLIDTLFQNELRQGFRISTNFRPTNKLFVGLNAGYRHQAGDIKPSRNYGGYISYSNLPIINVTPSFNFTKMTSTYVDGTDFGGRMSKYFTNNLNVALGYRRLSYSFNNVSNKIEQNILSADISLLILKNLSLSINYEGVFEKANTFSRFFIDLTTRF